MGVKTIKKMVKNVSLEAAQESGREYTACIIELDRLEAELNEQINQIKDKYKDTVIALQTVAKDHKAILEVFANEQKSTWGKRKSFELIHCTIGFRTNPPKVGKNKKFTWDAITELMKKSKALSRFLRTTVEINKEAILAEENEAVLNMLKEDYYICIEQDERFDVDVKKENLKTN